MKYEENTRSFMESAIQTRNCNFMTEKTPSTWHAMMQAFLEKDAR